MEPFEIIYYGVIFTILPQTDDSFTVFNQSELIGTVMPHSTDEALTAWTSKDIDDDELVDKIGDLIENYHNGY